MAKRRKISDTTDKPEDRRHEGLVKHCLDLYETFKKSEYRDAMIKLINEARKTYEQKEESTDHPWPRASNKILPFETITVDNLEPRLIAGLVGRDPIVAFGEQAALEDVEEVLQDWWNKELKEVVKIEEVARNVVHTLLLEGTRFSMVQYDKQELKRRDFIYGQDGQMQIDPKTQEPATREFVDPTFEGGKDEQIPFTDMFIADDIGTQDQWEEAEKIRHVEYTYGELLDKRDESGFRNIGAWLLPEKDKARMKEEDKSPSQIVAGVDVTGKETIKCIECHISYALHNLEEEDEKKRAAFEEERCIITIAIDSKLCIRKILQRDLNMNNQSLIKRVRLYPEEGRSYGTPIHGKLKSIQEGGSNIFNRMMNAADIIMLPWYFKEAGLGLKGDQKIQPGEGVEVEDTSKIVFPKFNIDIGRYIDLFNVFVGLWEKLSAMSEPRLGKPSAEKKTATEIMSVIEEGNIRFNYQAETFKEEFLSIIRTLYDLYYQHMPYDKKIEYGGKQGPLPRHAMRRPFNFRLTGSTERVNKLIERKENEDLFQLLRADPLVNPVEHLKDLLKSYGRDDTEKYIKPEVNQLVQVWTMAPEQTMQAIEPVVEMIKQMEQEGGGAGRPRG